MTSGGLARVTNRPVGNTDSGSALWPIGRLATASSRSIRAWTLEVFWILARNGYPFAPKTVARVTVREQLGGTTR